MQAWLAPKIAELNASLPKQYRIETGGIAEESAASSASVFAVVPLMLMLMLTVLMFQLQSFRSLAVVLVILPLGMIGVVAALLAFNRPLGFVAILGILSLLGMIAKNADEKPKVPTMLHFGETDHSIPMSDVEIVKQKRPDVETYVYPAGHGFSCDERPSFHEPSHKQALDRTLAWLKKYVG